jgi:hypothetical protein
LIPRNNPQKKQAAFGIHVNPDTPLDSPSLKTENPAHSDIGNQITRSTRFSPCIEENPAINIKKTSFSGWRQHIRHSRHTPLRHISALFREQIPRPSSLKLFVTQLDFAT